MKYLFGFLISMVFLTSHAQTWVVFNTSNSKISDNQIQTINIENNGTLWIGSTYNGLMKFDGTNWTTYTIGNNSVRCFAIDKNNNKWIGTGTCLSKYDGTNWTNYTSDNSGIAGSMTYSVLCSGDEVWAGSGFSGLSKFISPNNWTVYNSSNSSLPDNYVWCITQDANNNKWIGTIYGGLAKFDGTNWTLYNVSNSSLPNNQVRAITIDKNGELWIGTYGGVARINGNTWTVYNTSNSGLPDNSVNDIKIDSKGNKWIATTDGGLAKFDGNNWTIYNTSNSILPVNFVRSLAISSDDVIWIGTDNGLVQHHELETGSSNENSPTISPQNFSIAENSATGTSVGTVIASDADAGQTLTYDIISGNTGNAFAINSATGAITVARALDYETISSYSLTVQVTDNGSPSKNASAVITIAIIEETTGIVSGVNSSNIMLYPNPAKGTAVITPSKDFGYATISVLNASGKIVQESRQTFSTINSTTLDLNGLPSGIYLVQITSDSGTESKTLIIE